MLIDHRGKKLKVTFSGECTISEVESDSDTLRASFERSQVEEINVSIADLTEIDTAYLQLLLALDSTANELGIQIKVLDTSPLLDEVAKLYGLNFPNSHTTGVADENDIDCR